MKRTKIVATISDKRCEVVFLRELFEAGMNVVRLNTAHQTLDEAMKVIQNVRAVSEQIALLIDTKGPEVRTTGVEIPVRVEKRRCRLYERGFELEKREIDRSIV